MSAGGRCGRGADANRHNRAPPATPSPLTGPQPEVTHGGYAGLPARPAATTGSAICGASGPCGASSPEPLGSVLRKRARCAGTTLRLHPLASAPGFPDRGLRLLRRGRRGPPIPSDAQRWAEAEPGGVKALGKRVSSGTPPRARSSGAGVPGDAQPGAAGRGLLPRTGSAGASAASSAKGVFAQTGKCDDNTEVQSPGRAVRELGAVWAVQSWRGAVPAWEKPGALGTPLDVRRSLSSKAAEGYPPRPGSKNKRLFGT